MKRNLPFDRYGADDTYNSPNNKLPNNDNGNNFSIKDFQLKEKDDFTRKLSELGKSELNSENY